MKRKIIHFVYRFRNTFLSMLLLVLLVSCLNDDDNNNNQPIEVAYVSIYHASPDAPSFNIFVDGRVINRNSFGYSSYSGYLNFFTGNREIQFKEVNASNALIDTTFDFQNGKVYSLFAINRLSNIEALLVVDSAATPATGKAMVRFVNLSPDAPAFDITLEGQAGAPLFADQSFKQSSEFKEIDAGTYTFDVKDAGASNVVLSSGDVVLRAGGFYTIITRGFTNPPQGNTNILSVEVLDSTYSIIR